jgi:hypothetical protein
MNSLLICVAILAGQMMNTLQSKPVVYLTPHRAEIQETFGGKLLKLINAPAVIFLPPSPPKLDYNGNPWAVDVTNFGPSPVTVVDPAVPTFKIVVSVNQTMHFIWNGTVYFAKR